MQNMEYSFKDFNFSSQLIRDLVEQKASIKPFVTNFFSFDSIYDQAQKKGFSESNRVILTEQLNVQNSRLNLSEKSRANISSLKANNTFTITTGHQLNLLTGPLYSIYKVLQVVSICNHMNSKHDGNHYVPVFWMATEDHDFEEINHLHLFGEKIAWNKDSQEEVVVGEILTAEMEPFLQLVEQKYREDTAREIIKKFTTIYRANTCLADATRVLMNELFGEFGLVVIDGNDKELKKIAAPLFKAEITNDLAFNAVSKTNEELSQLGYHAQVFLRNCNLFHISVAGKRERISKEGTIFTYDRKNYTAEELVTAFDNDPSRFSPNALLRPVYQEMILPNLVYIGGGGEIAYWLQLKGVFDALNVPFPLLRVRDSILLLNQKQLNDIEEVGFDIPTLKKDTQDLVKQIALAEVTYDITLNNEQAALEDVKISITDKVRFIDQSLIGMIEAEFTKMSKSLEKVEQRLIKSEKGRHEVKEKKINKLKDKIYPEGGFQERYDSFIPFFIDNSNFINDILQVLKSEDEPKIRIHKL